MKNIIENFSVEKITHFFWNKVLDFIPNSEDFSDILKENEKFSDLEKLGEAKVSDDKKDVLFFAYVSLTKIYPSVRQKKCSTKSLNALCNKR